MLINPRRLAVIACLLFLLSFVGCAGCGGCNGCHRPEEIEPSGNPGEFEDDQPYDPPPYQPWQVA